MTESNIRSVMVTSKAEWLMARKEGVGASEAPAVLGASPWESPRQVYLRKRGLLPEPEETEAMRWGSLLEPVILAEYERRTGHKILAQQMFYRDTASPLMATVDAMTSTHPVEVKTVGAHAIKELGDQGTDHIPDHWIIQAQQQMILTGTAHVDFAILVGGQRLVIRPVPRHAELCRILNQRIRRFWEDLQAEIAPQSDARLDRGIMHILYPDSDGEIELDDAAAALLAEYEAEGAAIRSGEDRRSTLRARLLDLLGNHACGRLPDGRTITRKVVNVPESTYTRQAYSYAGMWIHQGTRRIGG